MAEELQSLLEKIQRDGIEKAAAERDEILKKAQADAAAITAEAQRQAQAMLTEAAAEAGALKKRAESAIRQAARDILLELKSELKKRLEAITRQRLDEALSAEFIAGIVQEVAIQVFNNPQMAGSSLEVMVSPAKCSDLISKLTASVGADLVAKMTVFPNSSAGRGLKISVDGDQVFFDFSDSALTEMICDYAGSRVSAILSE